MLRGPDGVVLTLVGATAPTRVVAGDGLAVQLRWMASGDPTVDAEEVVQLVNSQGTAVAQIACRPHSGCLPTNDWISREQLND